MKSIKSIAIGMVYEVIEKWVAIYKNFESHEIFELEMKKMSTQRGIAKKDFFGCVEEYIPEQLRQEGRFLCGGLFQFVLENLCFRLGLRAIGTDYICLPLEVRWDAELDVILNSLIIRAETRFNIEILKEAMARDKNLDLFVRSLIKAAEKVGKKLSKPGQIKGNFKSPVEVKIKNLLLE